MSATMSSSHMSALLERIAASSRPFASHGKVASYIPALASVSPHKFGMAFASSETESEVVGVGDYLEPFTLQSISKVFTLSLVLTHEPTREEHPDSIWSRVGREPSGSPFNSLVQLEYEKGIPRNPYINAGALVVTDRLVSLEGDAFAKLRQFLVKETGNTEGITLDTEIYQSESRTGHRNRALAHFISSFGNLHNPVDLVLDHYFKQCSLKINCADLARAGLFLARHGVCNDGKRFLSCSNAKRINAVMLTCGAYDAAGDLAYRIGLPIKTGVCGAILAVLPGRGCVCVWSPPLGRSGNSVAAVEALDMFTTKTGWSVF
eukprot:gnl/Spiro4/13166_TR6984_c0_g1_i1.p1 gnl/Spiro4/13166_TR6984_c0_g1~~gnl/Spiro4/13166_TR6984_c0_g1_i1.p1  ORF type:complete len:340 (+),score=90.33 gnl/Spiro4/13166_TR6984_c0_g1_i1:61-1020(+)